MKPSRRLCIAISTLLLSACQGPSGAPEMAPPIEDSKAFATRVNRELTEMNRETQAAGWVAQTYITPDSEYLATRAGDRWLAYFSQAAAQARIYEKSPLDAETARTLTLLRLGVSAPAPSDAAKRAELARLLSRMSSAYGEGKGCHTERGKEICRNIDELSEVLATSRDPAALTQAWQDWHGVGRTIRDDYAKFVELANEGARDFGYADLGAYWRSAFDMSPEAFSDELDRLWTQVRPLYLQMHCYTRAKLAKRYGEDAVPAGKPIPAQLLGNLWAQQWNKLYDDVLRPFPKVATASVDGPLKAQGYDAQRMVRSAEQFYVSLGFDPLPQTFWQRSLFTRPRDREVVCHPSAWHMDAALDLRLKQCITVSQEDLEVVYHELGHLFYGQSYRHQPYLFQGGANDAFHEAIGDTIVLSMTPQYLRKVGLRPAAAESTEAVINRQMQLASDRVAFLPFGLLVDQWRWKVFSGEVKPADYNAAWWALREKLQGVRAPVARSEADFDPGAKYHVPANSTYAKYFLAAVLQFQLHRALCQTAGHAGPLHECSIFGNAAAGAKLREMLAAGASRPWQETLEKLTGSRDMDASAIVDYFQPLMQWLEKQNAGQQCEWS